jgi:hypothetical protein
MGILPFGGRVHNRRQAAQLFQWNMAQDSVAVTGIAPGRFLNFANAPALGQQVAPRAPRMEATATGRAQRAWH